MQEQYTNFRRVDTLPRIPLKGSLDLTYRCNNNCRHCWLRIAPDTEEKEQELSLEEIKRIVDDAKGMGCRHWHMSGGEPMLRGDFVEIFDHITANSNSYSLNTNGTLITPEIAKLLKRKGVKMVALYGSTAWVHDHITCTPGSFEATMRGFTYLKEAGAGFIVQLIPMRDNYHQFQDMVRLAESLSKHYKIGAAWLYFSACSDSEKNQEIMRQRLSPGEVVEIDKPDLAYEDSMNKAEEIDGCSAEKEDYFFSSCIANRRDFHIDPYGKMTFCSFIKEPVLRYDLRKGSFKECWEEFIPSLAHKIGITDEYLNNCGSCELRKDCRWCPVYSYLEHRRFSAKVEYLCGVAKENRKFKENWKRCHRRHYNIADITIQVDSDLPINDATFHPKFRNFEVSENGRKDIVISHHFNLPDLNGKDLGEEVYRKAPWAIYKNNGSWIYLGISPTQGDKSLHRVAAFNPGHTRVRIYNDKEETFLKGNLHSLTMFPTDQILLGRILADKEGCYLHACGVNLFGKGFLFAGHSEAGKSTMAAMLKGKAEILCDDRMIVRRQTDDFKIYGTWSHGDVPEVSANFAPLRVIMFLEKSDENRIIPIEDKKEITKRLLSCLIKPFVTVDWWEKTLIVIDVLAAKVPCCVLRFDKSGEIVNVLRQL